MEPVRWGIIGYGWVARDYMAPAIRDAGGRLVAVCDPGAAAREAAERGAVRAYAAPDALCADPEVEAVYVATPNHLHRQGVEAAARAGKAVLCEKPVAASFADARAMAAAVRRAGVLYGTAFDQRWHPAHRAMRDEIAAGRVGRPTAVRIAYCCWVCANWAKVEGHANWRSDPAQAGGGALMDLAPHGLDLTEFLLGEPVEEVRALTQNRVQTYPVDDGGMIIGRTASGVLLSLHVSYNCPEGLPRRRLEVLGSTGQLTALNTMGQDPGGRLVHTDGATGAVRPVDVPEANLSPFLAQARAFGRALRGGDRSEWSMDRDLHTMRLLEACYGRAPAPEPA